MSLTLGGIAVSRETADMIAAFELEFQRWAARINLVAPSTLPDMKMRHVADSAQVLALAPEVRTIVDLGSGGGFPGLILAVLLKETPGAQVHLVESNTKKCGFLRHMTREFALPATIHNQRIEAVIGGFSSIDLVTARALAPLALLLDLALPLLARDTRAMFHKGRDHVAEIAVARGAFDFDLLVHPSQTDADGVLLDISRVRRKAAL
jgi:16S rRNA (guanine527-N7)-methyltransferase